MKFSQLFAGASVALALGLFGGGSASAAVIVTDVELAGPGPHYTVDITVPGFATEDAYDDALILTSGGKQFLVNCDDLIHNIYTGGGQQLSFGLGSVSSNFNAGVYSTQQIERMGWLLDQSIAVWKAQGPDETIDLAAYQLASWEIGNPSASFVASDGAVQSLATSFAADSVGKAGSIVQFASLDDAQSQISAVPEPASWAMMLFGAGLIGAGLRLARRKDDLSPNLA